MDPPMPTVLEWLAFRIDIVVTDSLYDILPLKPSMEML